jgi:hypothetical protein
MMKKKLLVLFLAVTQVLVFLTAGAAEKELFCNKFQSGKRFRLCS